jgi:OPA family glycerol-3-phosphate transporter-like MFS transporter/OPA family sugar phosphate sensor protein UhpC-like MFS transporter
MKQEEHALNDPLGSFAPETRKRFLKWQWRTIVATMVGYALYYFVRKNFSFAMVGIQDDYGISKGDLGLVITLNGLIYGFSRFANGLFADRLNARWYMSIGLFLCAVANIAFGFGADISTLITGETGGALFNNTMILFMGIMWTLVGLLQGTGFPPCARLLTHWIPPTQLATKMSVWNTSHSIGAGLVVILCGYIMSHMGTGPEHFGAWKWCFWIPAGIALAGSIFLFATLRDTPSSVGLPELPGTESKTKVQDKSKEYRRFLWRKVFGNKLIWILGFANFFVYVVRFFILDWGPMLLKESKGLSMAHSGWLVALFELSGILGMLVAGWVTDRYLKGRAHRTCVFCMIGAALFMSLFWLLPGTSPIWMIYAALALSGFCIYGPQALIGIAAANQATKKAAATANGVTGIFGYASVLVSGWGLGKVAEVYGWNPVYQIVIGIAVVGIFVFMLMWNAKADGYNEEVDESVLNATEE